MLRAARRWSLVVAMASITSLAGVVVPAGAAGADEAGGFTAVPPVRDVDTRIGLGGGVLGAGNGRFFHLASVPPSAAAATLNVTAVGATADGYLSVTDCAKGSASSAVNFVAHRPTPNQVTVGLSGSTNRGICIASSQPVHVVVDVFGYTTDAATSSFVPMSGREWDTRSSGGIGGNGVLAIDLAHRTDATDAVAWSGTVTATGVTAPGFVTVYPCSQPRPSVSSLNLVVGVTKANQVTVALPADDPRVCLYREGHADLVVDTTGVWVDHPFATITPASPPQRIIDTRGGDRVLADEVRRLHAPADSVLFVNVTATAANTDGWLALFACGAGHLGTSTLNIQAHEDVSSAAIVGAGDGGICVTTSASTHVIVDVYAVQHTKGSSPAIVPGVPLVGVTLESGIPDDPNVAQIGSCVSGSLAGFNAARAALGRAPLVSDERTDKAACDWAREMAVSATMKHSPASFRVGVDACGVNGENVAAGGTSWDWMVEGWLASSPHRENILHPLFHRASVAYVSHTLGGTTTWYGVMSFGGDC